MPRSILITLIIAVALLLHAPRAWSEDEPLPAREVSIASVLSALRQEAMGWNRNQRFPREEPDFARQRGVTVPEADVIRMLSRRLHQEPAVDAYMKWQLMSFEPDLSRLTPEEYERIIEHLPRMGRLPGPEDATNARVAQALQQRQAQRRAARQAEVAAQDGPIGGIPAGSRPTLSVVQEGTVLDAHAFVNPTDPRYLTMTVRADLAQVGTIRQVPVLVPSARLVAGNAAAADARAQVIRSLPRDNGVRLIAMFTDLRDRIAAGDPSVGAAAVALAQEASEVGHPNDLTPSQLEHMHDWASALALMRTPIYRVERFEGAMSQSVSVEWVAVSRDLLRGVAQDIGAMPSDVPEEDAGSSAHDTTLSHQGDPQR